jgi:hypothetical protein
MALKNKEFVCRVKNYRLSKKDSIEWNIQNIFTATVRFFAQISLQEGARSLWLMF